MTNENEAGRMMSVIDAGHRYDLHNVGEGIQSLAFIKKEPVEGATELKTVQDGTTNEAVLQVLIHRLKVLQEKMPHAYNESAINHLEIALGRLELRTREREERNVEGTTQP